MDPKLFYTLKLAHLNHVDHLLREVNTILTDIHKMEKEAPGGDVEEFDRTVCNAFENLHQQVECARLCIHPLLGL